MLAGVFRWLAGLLLGSGARWMQAVLRVAGDGALAPGAGGSLGVSREAVPQEHLQGERQEPDPGWQSGEGGAGWSQLPAPHFP